MDHDLLKLICLSPMTIFTKESIEMGIFIWDWLIALSPQSEIWILIELYSGWEWLMNSQYGLFSPSSRLD
jgi:hypothetical protein